MCAQELTERDIAEMKRSASEASKVTLKRFNPAQVNRYLDPPANTVHPLEYAFHLLGDVRGKTVLDLLRHWREHCSISKAEERTSLGSIFLPAAATSYLKSQSGSRRVTLHCGVSSPLTRTFPMLSTLLLKRSFQP